VAELEEHGEHAMLADPVLEVVRADAVRFRDGEDVVPVKDVFLELMQEIEDARRVRLDAVDMLTRPSGPSGVPSTKAGFLM
jgi:hypothetical protein